MKAWLSPDCDALRSAIQQYLAGMSETLLK